MLRVLLQLGVSDRRGEGEDALRLLQWLEVFCRSRVQADGYGKGGGFVGCLPFARALELVACHRFLVGRSEEKLRVVSGERWLCEVDVRVLLLAHHARGIGERVLIAEVVGGKARFACGTSASVAVVRTGIDVGYRGHEAGLGENLWI